LLSGRKQSLATVKIVDPFVVSKKPCAFLPVLVVPFVVDCGDAAYRLTMTKSQKQLRLSMFVKRILAGRYLCQTVAFQIRNPQWLIRMKSPGEANEFATLLTRLNWLDSDCHW
jgi:hypothetical protein